MAIELGDPESALVLDDGLGPGPAHGGADQKQILDLLVGGVRRDLFVGNQGVGDTLQLLQRDGLVEIAARRRRIC